MAREYYDQKYKTKWNHKKLRGERAKLTALPTHDGIDMGLIASEGSEITQSRDLSAVHPSLIGVDIPVETNGPFSPVDRERWLLACEIIMSRGVEHTGKISGMTGLSMNQVIAFKDEIMKRWQTTVPASTINARRERLYLEADRVKQELWRMFEQNQGVGETKEQVLLLKMVLDAGQRQAQLCGLNRVDREEDYSQQVIQKDKKRLIEEAEQKLKLPTGGLANIGKELAKSISQMKDEETENDQ